MATKAELETERDQLLAKLEDAYAIIGEALGYEEAAGDESDDDDDDGEVEGD